MVILRSTLMFVVRRMSNAGFAVDIRKVADNDKQLALFLGIAFLFVWVVAINIGVQDLAPRWFQRQFDWLASEDIPPIFLSMAFASLIAAAGVWLFSGDGDKLFHIGADGIDRSGFLGTAHYRWNDFERLERQVSMIILHVKPGAKPKFGPQKLVFDVAGLDCTGPQLEALLVHYRPDLYRSTAMTGAKKFA
jgi:hypothetical protein